MVQGSGIDGVWICELEGRAHVWYWLCPPCVFELRAERNAAGLKSWLYVRPRRKVDGDCTNCTLRREEEIVDELSYQRMRRAAVWSPGLSRVNEGGKIVERIVSG